MSLLATSVAAFPQQQGAENSNDGQVEEEADEEGPHSAQEGWQHPASHQRGPPGHHVSDDGLHLEVCAHHGADVEELVAVACGTKVTALAARIKCFSASVPTCAPKSPLPPQNNLLFCCRETKKKKIFSVVNRLKSQTYSKCSEITMESFH